MEIVTEYTKYTMIENQVEYLVNMSSSRMFSISILTYWLNLLNNIY